MKIFSRVSLALCLVFFMFGQGSSALAATTPSLGAAASYGVLAGTYSNSSAATTINGDVGFTTGPSQAPLGTHANYGPGAPTPTARTDAANALSPSLSTQACTFTFPVPIVDLATDGGFGGVYTPGVYCSTGAMNIGVGGITLNGSGTYIFRAVGALTTTAGAVVTSSGASACDVFWTPTAATTLAANTTFWGTIIDNANAITVGANTTWTGRALSLGAGTVTTGNTDTITAPTCAPAPATLHVIKQVVNTGGGTALPSSFNLHVTLSGTDVSGSPKAGSSTPGSLYTLSAGTYQVSEDTNASYTQSFFGADCVPGGSVTLLAGDDKTCTIINTNIPPPVVVLPSTGPTPIVPLIGILKVPSPLALPAGPALVTYNYTVWNVGGQQALTNVTVTDDKCGPITLISGDSNSNSKLDIGESWKYSCSTTLSKTTTNTAIATGYSDDIYHQPAIATAITTVVVGAPLTPPLINIVKVPSRLTPFPFGGGNVTYTYIVTNPGVASMNNVTVTDDKCGPVSRVSGDTNGNNLLDPGETWTYTCQTNVPISTRNVATAKGSANGFTTLGYAFATVLVSGSVLAQFAPTPGLPNAGLPPQGNSIPRNTVTLCGIFVASLALYLIWKKQRV